MIMNVKVIWIIKRLRSSIERKEESWTSNKEKKKTRKLMNVLSLAKMNLWKI